MNEMGKKNGILFTAIRCDDGCDTSSLIIRFEKSASREKYNEVQEAIWKVFGKELPEGRGGCIAI